MKKYCDKCNKKVDTEVIEKEELYNVRGEDICVLASVRVCSKCGDEFYDEILDNETALKAFSIYRNNHNLLQPEEIRDIREMYGLSQRSFASLLNFSDKTIRRYENGSIQNTAHNNLIAMLKDPNNMLSYLNNNEVDLSDNQLSKLLEKTNSLINELNSDDFRYEKFIDMVLFFVNNNKCLLKTKLMKLLNYSDMIFYKEYGDSISGLRYVHYYYGPVPEDIDFLISKLIEDKIVDIKVKYNGGFESHVITACEPLRISSLTDDEFKVITEVNSFFRDFNSSEISEYSHKEVGYINTKHGEIISYDYARYIDLT